MLQIRDVYPRSRIRNFSLPDPGSRIRIKEFKYFNPKKWFLSSRKCNPGSSFRIRILNTAPTCPALLAMATLEASTWRTGGSWRLLLLLISTWRIGGCWRLLLLLISTWRIGGCWRLLILTTYAMLRLPVLLCWRWPHWRPALGGLEAVGGCYCCCCCSSF